MAIKRNSNQMAVYECKYCKQKFHFSIRLDEHIINSHQNIFIEYGFNYFKRKLRKKAKLTQTENEVKQKLKPKKNKPFPIIISAGLPRN